MKEKLLTSAHHPHVLNRNQFEQVVLVQSAPSIGLWEACFFSCGQRQLAVLRHSIFQITTATNRAIFRVEQLEPKKTFV